MREYTLTSGLQQERIRNGRATAMRAEGAPAGAHTGGGGAGPRRLRLREACPRNRGTHYPIEMSDCARVPAGSVAAATFVDRVIRMAFDNRAEHEAPYGRDRSIAEMPHPRVQSHPQLPLALRGQSEDRAPALPDALRGLRAAEPPDRFRCRDHARSTIEQGVSR